MTPTEKAKQLLAMRQASERANVVSPAFAETTSVLAAMIDEVVRLREALKAVVNAETIPYHDGYDAQGNYTWSVAVPDDCDEFRAARRALAGEQGDDHE